MIDTNMPTNIWALKSKMDTSYTGTYCDVDDGGEHYTLVHNNHDYHVIKKSDVDANMPDNSVAFFAIEELYEMACTKKFDGEKAERYAKTLRDFVHRLTKNRNALIVQTDTIVINRSELEKMGGAIWKGVQPDGITDYENGYQQAIDDIINMLKEGE